MSMSQAPYLSFPQPEAVPLATTGTQDNGLDHEPRKDTPEPCKQCPELLEALQSALERLKAFEVHIDGEWGWCRKWEQIEESGEHCPEITTARAAIAKAKAGQS